MTLKSLLDLKKRKEVWFISIDDSIFTEIKTMIEKGTRGLLVKNKDAVVGMLSVRDIARKMVLKAQNPTVVKVKDLYSSPLIIAQDTDGVVSALSKMKNHHIRHLPVMGGDGKPVGLLTEKDIMTLL